MNFSTPDLCDEHADQVQVCTGLHWHSYGGKSCFGGEIATVKCFEDNSRIKETLAEDGRGRVLVVDGGASLRHALIGDLIASGACDLGWSGVLLNGACRDVEVLSTLDIGVFALGAVPIKSVRRSEGQTGIPVRFGGVSFVPGQFVYVDTNGVIIAGEALV